MSDATGSGKVKWIGLRVGRDESMQSVQAVRVDSQSGLEGDRFQSTGPERRQLTLVQQEHLPVIASLMGRDKVGPEVTRRNILVSGINLLSLKDQQFQVGECVFHCTGPCEPCSRMNTTLGPGGLVAMAGHGGIMASVVKAGTIRVGDQVSRVSQE
jgi:MOSC domain-containing protein YiiM